MKIIPLTISSQYVQEWGLWKAVRELLQNAYDERDTTPGCQVVFSHLDNVVTISTSTGNLPVRSLLLGETTKADSSLLRGKFGEGYKLALLVLTRLKYKVKIYNGTEIWCPIIEHDQTFNAELLKIYIYEGESYQPGVSVKIEGVTLAEWNELYDKVTNSTGDCILWESSEKGKIYVGGLYVCTEPPLKYGYAFSPRTVKLDRDRGMVNDFDVRLATSKLWILESAEERYRMLKENAPDVEYLDHAATWHYPDSNYLTETFLSYKAEYKEAIPVATQEEIQKVQAAGMAWALVPILLKRLLWVVKSWVIPSTKPPLTRLKELFAEIHLTDIQKVEAKEILKALGDKDNDQAT